MTKFTTAFASTAAALLLAGNAMAQMPAAGQGPYAENEVRVGAAVKSEVTRQPVSIKQVAVGQMDGVVQPAADINSPSRAEVREQTREAIARGARPASGERS